MKLLNPTAATLIAYLKNFPPETPVRIIDADTGWIISTFRCEVEKGTLEMGGKYGEMEKKPVKSEWLDV